MNNNLKPLWEEILSIYDVFSELCRKHNLRFYVAYGTALGAVRHQGFIPWDDDFDVVMPRPDYERFCKLASDELPPHLWHVTWKSVDGYPQTFSKVQECRKSIIEGVEAKVGFSLPQGIYIDIFVIDGYPESWYGKAKIKYIGWTLKLLHRRFTRNLRDHRKILGYCAWLCSEVCRWFNPGIKSVKDFPRYIEKTLLSVPYATSNACYVFSSLNYSEGPNLPKSTYGNPKYLRFEGRHVPVPYDVHTYLSAIYGDYMTLPPENKRVQLHANVSPSPWRCTESGVRPCA